MKHFFRAFCALLLTMTCAMPAIAEIPREIHPLDYDTLPAALEGQHHYLLACVDTWETKPTNLGNTDGVMMVTFDTRAKRLLFTTFMREMLVQRPDGEIGRITYIAKTYSPEALCKTISTHFGVKVDQYILFSMDNVQDIIDKLGGVKITVTDSEADYLNRYRIARDATTPQHGSCGHVPVQRSCGGDLHAHPQGGQRWRCRAHAPDAHRAWDVGQKLRLDHAHAGYVDFKQCKR